MKILAIDLPSHGFNSRLGMVNLSPMTYLEMINYSSDSSNDKLTQLKVDINLLRKDNLGIDELNYYDFESVLLMKKIISVTSTPKFKLDVKCPGCDALNILERRVEDIRYTSFDGDTASNISSITLGNTNIKIRMPKLRDVDKLITLMQNSRSEVKFEIFKSLLICEFGDRPNDVVNAVNSATLDEILLLEHLKTIFIGGLQNIDYDCINCGRKESVALKIDATGMFRLLQLNENISKDKIAFSKRV